MADADGVALALWWLQLDPVSLAYVDGDPLRIGGRSVPPWPRYVVEMTVDSQDAYTRWRGYVDLRLSAYSTREGVPGEAGLRAMLVAARNRLYDLPGHTFTAQDAVCTAATETLGVSPVFEPSGHLRLTCGVRLNIHPPLSPAVSQP